MYNIGIDLGGTNIKGAVVGESGEILREASRRTETARGAERVMDQMAELIRELENGLEISGVGIGCPGTVDNAAGVVRYANNLGWAQVDLRGGLEARTGYAPQIANDANAAALGEALAGCAKGAKSAVILTLGTGVGGGVVLDGKLLTGYTGAAAEPGHMVIVDGGAPCTCGRRGCLEAYASATALIQMTKEAMARLPESKMHAVAAALGEVNGLVAFSARDEQDAAGAEVVERYIHYLALGVANVINLFFPEVVALSGGVANQGERLLSELSDKVRQQVYGGQYAEKHTRLALCTLGYQAGVIGAAMLNRSGG